MSAAPPPPATSRAAARTRSNAARSSGSPRLLPLGALAAGFGLVQLDAMAQVAPPTPPATPASAAASGVTLTTVRVKEKVETDANSVRAGTTTIGRGLQELRDIPQGVTVVTEKLLEDRRTDTVKEALHYTAGITFQAAEGGEEDIRLRGFSLTASGDIFADGVRDPAFYERDVFNFDRIELLRGSASMLFGRGSTGGVVNQVSKQPLLADVHEVSATVGNGKYVRATGDFNLKTSDTSAVRLNVMRTQADNFGNGVDKYGIAPTFRWGIGTADEFSLGYYRVDNDNGINYGIPWLRGNTSAPISEANPAVLVPVNPRNYYGAASDYSAGYASYGTFTHTHRFGDGGQWHTVLRQGGYDRDQRASTIRFCTRTATANLDCPAEAPTRGSIDGSSVLTRGGASGQNKVQDMTTTYLQTDYTNKLALFGRTNEILAGLDLAREKFANYALTPLASTKALPRVTVGSPDDGASFDENARDRDVNRRFVAKAVGAFVQDTVEVAPNWKVLAGLRFDRFMGDYVSPATTAANGTVAPEQRRSRGDSLWSQRFGVIWQPTGQSSFYASYGTSFNTSGELYNYDAQGSNTPPEKSRNIEIGAKLDLFDGNLSTRAAVFHSTKYNERNRDSPNGVPLENYLLSGKRHAAGFELDVAGRITPAWEAFLSYALIPSAKIDTVQGVTLTGELAGQRPSLTPRHSGSLFTTYQLTSAFRFGGGLNARSTQTPNRNPAGIVAPGFVTCDVFGEYAFTPQVVLKLNLLNVTNKLYADSLYTAHYVPGQPRTFYATLVARF